MARLALFMFLLFFLAACTQHRYTWQHEEGLSDVDLKQAQEVCHLYAEKQAPPIYYSGYPYYPYYYGGHFYGHRGHRLYSHRHFYGYRGFYRPGYYGGYNTYAYQQDISRACLKGKGWNRVRIDEG